MSKVFLTRDEIEHPYANLSVMLEDKRKKAEQMRRTVFARITQSPETLATEFVSFDHGLYYSWFIGQYFNTYTEAIAATVAKLKEVAE